jgi:tetratricopeptide (TPR) repeat protein
MIKKTESRQRLKIKPYSSALIPVVWIILIGTAITCSHRPSAKPEALSAPVDTVKSYDSRAVEHFMAGEQFSMQENYAMAILEYQDALQYDSSSNTIYVSMAKAYINLGKLDRGIQALKKALSLDKNDPEAREILAQIYFLTGDAKNAEQEYQILHRAAPTDIEVTYQLAAVYLKNKKLDNALQLYEEIFAADSSQVKALEKAAEIAIVLKDTDRAAAYYDKLIAQNPGEINYYKYRADIALMQNNIPTALELYQNLLQIAPQDTEIQDRYGDLLARSDSVTEAVNYLQTLMQKNPERENAYISLAYLYARKDYFDQLYQLLDSATVKFPGQPYFFIINANSLLKQKQYQAAEASLLKALEIDKDNIQAQIILANVWDTLTRYDLSDSLYSLILTENPDLDIALNNFAYSLAQRGKDLEKASLMVNKALQLAPDNASYLDTKGWLLYLTGNYREAKEYVEKAISLTKDNPEILEHLGDILMKLNKSEEAKGYYRQALEYDPDNEALKQKLLR